LAAEDWNVSEEFTFAAGLLTVYLPAFYIVVVVSFEFMSAEAAGSWTDRPAVLA